MLTKAQVAALEYPESDGQPMAETGFHVTLIAFFIGMLRAFFRHRPDVYVGGNMFVYYQEGDPKKRAAPDVFVAFGVPSHERRSWFVWKEGKAPDVVFEFTSKETRDEDVDYKKELYQQIGVREYFLFDPLGDYLTPPLQGFRLGRSGYQPLALSAGQIASDVLGLLLRGVANELHLYDRATGTRLLPQPELAEAYLDEAVARQEAEKRAGAAEVRLQEEIEARAAAEAELARLREELARLKGNGQS